MPGHQRGCKDEYRCGPSRLATSTMGVENCSGASCGTLCPMPSSKRCSALIPQCDNTCGMWIAPTAKRVGDHGCAKNGDGQSNLSDFRVVSRRAISGFNARGVDSLALVVTTAGWGEIGPGVSGRRR